MEKKECVYPMICAPFYARLHRVVFVILEILGTRAYNPMIIFKLMLYSTLSFHPHLIE